MGYEAYIVGGCVRDFLLGKLPNDYDITTSARPEMIKSAFVDHKTLSIGEKHGTITVIVDGEPYEVTTYRTDGDYVDHRHPTSVTFSSTLGDDLSRRDFTMNAICYSDQDGIVDMFSGIDDIRARVVRAVGDPQRRFEEDALRIMRAVRFAAVLDFDIDSETARAIREKTTLLNAVSAERILVEWRKLIAGSAAYRILEEFKGVFEYVLPALRGVELPPRADFISASPRVRELMLFAPKKEMAEQAFIDTCIRLKADKSTRLIGAAALSALGKFDLTVDRGIMRAVYSLGLDGARMLCALSAALRLCPKDAPARLDRIIASGAPLSVSDLAIGGSELMELGISGAKLGIALKDLIIKVIDGSLPNERQALMDEIKKEGEKYGV
jgi:tRNA nucleotidyltransferase (CCA-adding enzyme)